MGNKPLSIPGHVINMYRERVESDGARFRRTDYQIKDIIGRAFRNSFIPKNFPDELNVIVKFNNPQESYSFGNYYLTVKRDSINSGGLVAMTIKNVDLVRGLVKPGKRL